jgi:ABC-type cobalamin/Fe3+-siderophores transport system ATPase subunit
MSPGSVVVRTSGLSHRYGRRIVLDGITLDVPGGCLAGIIGPDGVGKSTLFGLIAGARRVRSGAVVVLGRDMRSDRFRSTVSGAAKRDRARLRIDRRATDHGDRPDGPRAPSGNAAGRRRGEGPGRWNLADVAAASDLTLKEAKDQWLQVLEGAYLRDLLARHDGNVSSAAKAAGIDRKTFHGLINKYDLRAR